MLYPVADPNPTHVLNVDINLTTLANPSMITDTHKELIANEKLCSRHFWVFTRFRGCWKNPETNNSDTDNLQKYRLVGAAQL